MNPSPSNASNQRFYDKLIGLILGGIVGLLFGYSFWGV